MSRTVCAHCGVGSIEGVPSELKRMVAHRDGFRDEPFYVHRFTKVCEAVQALRQRQQAEREAAVRAYNRWHLRLARWAGRQAGRIVRPFTRTA
jgi:hypothetical protein